MAALWKISINALPKCLALLLVCPALGIAADSTTELGGHTKLRLIGQWYPDDSLFHDQFSSSSFNTQGELRLNLEHRSDAWSFAANYQLAALAGEPFVLATDNRRSLDLTSIIDEGSDSALLHRMDRLWVAYTSEKTVVRLGRQALSWGNGLFYAPMDLVNPFDPAAIDTEYKAGDDMLYMQYLRDDGADIQGAYVVRRDFPGGDVSGDVATTAMKYHGFAGEGEYDVLLARHYGDDVVGFGVSHSIGGAHWSGDLVVTNTGFDTYAQLTTNLSYSWVWVDKNYSGVLEYHFNGFGQHAMDYDSSSLAGNTDLSVRLLRGESFTVGRHYLAGSVTIEVTPLVTVSPTLLMNVSDPSALLQLVTAYSLSDNMSLLASLSLPLGGNGSEFGGIESGVPDRYLSNTASVFAQLAWYF